MNPAEFLLDLVQTAEGLSDSHDAELHDGGTSGCAASGVFFRVCVGSCLNSVCFFYFGIDNRCDRSACVPRSITLHS